MGKEVTETHGGAKLKWLLGLVALVALLVASRLVPIQIRANKFDDAVRSQANSAKVEFRSPDVIRDELYQKAQELRLPVNREQIQVIPVVGGVAIEVRFSAPVDLILFQTSLNFHNRADSRFAD